MQQTRGPSRVPPIQPRTSSFLLPAHRGPKAGPQAAQRATHPVHVAVFSSMGPPRARPTGLRRVQPIQPPRSSFSEEDPKRYLFGEKTVRMTGICSEVRGGVMVPSLLTCLFFLGSETRLGYDPLPQCQQCQQLVSSMRAIRENLKTLRLRKIEAGKE